MSKTVIISLETKNVLVLFKEKKNASKKHKKLKFKKT